MAVVPVVTPAADEGRRVHKVARGEYLFKILRNYGFDQDEAQSAMDVMAADPKAYGLSSGSVHVVYPGDTITIPSPQEVRQRQATETAPPAGADPAAGSAPVLTQLPNVDAGTVQAAMEILEEGSLNRLAELLSMFNERNRPPAPPPPPRATPAPPAATSVPSPALRVSDLTARRVPPGAAVMRPAPLPAPPLATTTVLQQLPRHGDPFEHQVLENGFNVHRPYNALDPELWLGWHRCPTCADGSARLCVLVKLLSIADFWDDVVDAYGAAEMEDLDARA